MATLIDDDNPEHWAEEFCRIFNEYAVVDFEPTDDKVRAIGPGRMISWFANAMQTAIRLYQDRLRVIAQQDEDGTISITSGDLPQDVLISNELLTLMIEQHNRSIRNVTETQKMSFVEGFEEGRVD